MSNGALAGLVLSLIVSAAAPFVVFLLLRRRYPLSERTIGIGAAVFVVGALVLESAMHYIVLKAIPFTSEWLKGNKLGYIAYGVMAAGIFEEVGRFVGMRYFMKQTDAVGTPLSYGIGHGGIEAILLGALAQLQGVILAVLFNVGVPDRVLALTIPAPMLTKIHEQFANLTFLSAAAGGFERLVALGLHIALSFVVWRAVTTRKYWLLAAAIALHALADVGAGLYQVHIISSVFLAELWALGALVLIAIFARGLFRDSRTAAAA